MSKKIFAIFGLFWLLSLLNIVYAVPTIYLNDFLTNRNITEHVDKVSGFDEALWPWEIPQKNWSNKPQNRHFDFLRVQEFYTQWYRFKIENTSGDNQNVVFTLNNSFLNVVDVFIINSNGAIEKVWYTGVERGLATKPLSSSNYSFPFSINNRDNKEVYVKVRSHFNAVPKLEIQEQNVYNRHDAIEKVINGIVSGILFLVCLYSVIMFIFIREFRFGYYAILTLSITLCLWLTGSYMTILSRIVSEIDIVRLFLISNFLMQLGLLLTVSDLIFSKFSKRAKYATTIFAFLLFLGAVTSSFISISTSLHLVIVAFLILLLWSIYLIWVSLKQRDLIHLAYVIILVIFLVGCTIPFLCLEGILSEDIYAKATFFVVSVLASIVVAVSIGYRTYQEKRNRIIITKNANLRNRRYLQMLNFVSEGMFIVSIEGELKQVNPALCKILGYESLTDMNENRIYSFQSLCQNPRDFEILISSLLARIEKCKQSQDPNEHAKIETIVEKREILLKHISGKPLTVMATVRLGEDINGTFIIEGEAVDLTTSEDYRNQLDFVAHHDEVTGVFNRRYMISTLTQIFTLKEKSGSGIGRDYLCFIHLDNFKYINESTGHSAGDDLVKAVVNYLKKFVKETFEIVRLNSDEFAIIMCDTYMDETLSYVEKWRYGLSHLRFMWGDNIYTIVVNIGVVDIYEAKNSISNLLSYADIACNLAKDLGPNTIHIYSQENSKINLYQESLNKTTQILRSIDSREIFAVKQKINLLDTEQSDEEFIEITTRIKNEKNEVLDPVVLIGDKDEFNILPTIDEWLISGWGKTFLSNPQDFRLLNRAFISISYSTICDIAQQNKIFNYLKANSEFSHKLGFFLNEVQIGNKLHVVKFFMEKFQELGVVFALDSFGEGIGSFDLISKLPFSYVRITKKFTKNLTNNENNRFIIKSLGDLVRGLGKKSIVYEVLGSKEEKMFKSLGVDMIEFSLDNSVNNVEFVTSLSPLRDESQDEGLNDRVEPVI